MNNKTVKFISATIRNFRGIPDELVIPLDSPLTVIKAANGTGKSTVCHALEWLLTGKIEDLPKNTDFACKWGIGETSVSVDCMIGEKPYEIIRDYSSIRVSKGAEIESKIREIDLLDLLTPSTVSGGTPQAIGKAKRGWLRNSRWLYSNSLSLMVDNNKAEERQQIFADILGLGHITGNLRDLRDYRRELPSIKGVQNAVKKLADEISDLETRLDSNSPRVDQAMNLLSEIFEAFPEIAVSGRLSEDYKTAQLPVKLFEQRSIHKLETLGALSRSWDQFMNSKNQSISLHQALDDRLGGKQLICEEHSELSQKISSLEVKAKEGLRSINWAQQHLEHLNRWEITTSETTVAEYFVSTEISLQKLKKIFVELSWTFEKQETWFQSIDYIDKNLSALVDLVQQKNELAANVIHPPANIVRVERMAAEATGARSKAEAEFNALANLLDKLKEMGKELVQSHNGKHCPLCSHDWGSSNALYEQLIADQILTPEHSEAAQELAEARSTESSCLEKLRLADYQKKAYETYTARSRAVDGELDIFANNTSYLEVMGVTDFSKFDQDDIVHWKSRVEASISLSKIFESLDEVEGVLNIALNGGVRSRVLSARENLIKYLDYYQAQADKALSEKHQLDAQVNQLLDSIQAKSREIEEINSNISAISNSIDRFNVQWKEVVGEVPITLDSYNSTLASVKVEKSVADKYNEILSGCEAVVAIDIDTGQLNKLKREMEELSKKLEAGKQRFAVADQTIEVYAHHVRELTTASLAPLLNPANEIFSRLHANEVYKELSISDDLAGFRWTAIAEEDVIAMDAEEKFSQGQRQDLALSLFLARARNIEGSFVLDEPFAHLDDLNRVAMLDIFRLIATSMNNMNIIITTASDGLARHMAQKFSSVKDRHLLSTIYLEGNPRTGVNMSIVKNISD